MFALAGLATVLGFLAFATLAQAASGTWDRAWGMNVNGGGVFGVCTVAPNCLAGTAGGLGGEINGPLGVATDSSGDVYLADAGNLRIQKFDSTGIFQRASGMNVIQEGMPGDTAADRFEICTAAANCQAGTAGGLGGEITFPRSVATDAAGNVYLADANRIQKFDSTGNFDRAWGENVIQEGMPLDTAADGFEICTAAADCQAGSTGGLGGEMTTPRGVATDAAGNVYLSDGGNHRIQKFDSSGNFLRAWGKDVVLSGEHETAADGFEVCVEPAGSAPDDVCKASPGASSLGGEMHFPRGVATDGAGNVYVADRGNTRIQKFNSAGTFERTWGLAVNVTTGGNLCTAASGDTCGFGGTGGLGGEMNDPTGVATDSAGNLYVVDSNNQRIQRFDSTGSFERAWGENVIQEGMPGDTAADGFEICTAAADCQAGSTGGLGGEMSGPMAVAADSAGNVYVADNTNHRIQRFADPVVPPPSGPGPTPAAPLLSSPGGCEKLRRKLKRQERGLERADNPVKRSQIKRNIDDTRERLRTRGC